MRLIYKFLKDENAATAIEYGLIAAGISIVIITTVKGIGTKLNTTFGSISTQLEVIPPLRCARLRAMRT